MSGIYIHIPFCVRKCAYCDFLSFENGEDCFVAYTEAVINELRYVNFSTAEGLLRLRGDIPTKPLMFCESKTSTKSGKKGEALISTIYIGGGTPTVLPPALLCQILSAAQEKPLAEDVEITVETNPCTVDLSYLKQLKAAGANRLSIGVQTTHAHLLRKIGRIHTPEDAEKCFRYARQAGFANINIDLMLGLPDQTAAEWRETLEAAIALSPEHISAYSLTLERDLGWALPDDETERGMYHTARELLAKAGYRHYEISNFAKNGKESRHNCDCWTMKPYIGVGAGAHSFDGAARWHNTADLGEYLRGAARAPERLSYTELTERDLLSEKIILGLRLLDGVCEGELVAFGAETEKLVGDGLLERREGRVCLTDRGMDLANLVFLEYL
ncbi:MAG: radical SAM family heme chaperone HemW [Defluviitaleaceae bacterium]|nr:radical SAM family heme chaperone HemW [Defluviitaleaceae bacterium]